MLKIPEKALILSLTLLLTSSSCVKKPENPVSPSVKIGMEKKGDSSIFSVYFTCGLKNENDSTAFINVDGLIAIKNNSGIPVLTVPFKTAVILPFETGVVQEKIELTPDQAAPLLDFLSIKKERIESGEEPGNRIIDDRNVEMKKLDMEKKDIIELLRSKVK